MLTTLKKFAVGRGLRALGSLGAPRLKAEETRSLKPEEARSVKPEEIVRSCLIPAVADLSTWSSRDWSDGLQLETLPDLEVLAVRTLNSTYEITVLSGRTGDILVRGGQFYPEHTRARLAGSSLGGSFLKRHGVYVGFQMELHDEGRTIVTTQVQSIGRLCDDRVQ